MQIEIPEIEKQAIVSTGYNAFHALPVYSADGVEWVIRDGRWIELKELPYLIRTEPTKIPCKYRDATLYFDPLRNEMVSNWRDAV
jgi:hypothetical protein